MGKFIKGEEFDCCINPYFVADTVVYEECAFSHTSFFFGVEPNLQNVTFKNCTFKNCTFANDSYFNFKWFDGIVRFENCHFRSSVHIRGRMYKGGKVKFVKCRGLTRKQFDAFVACGQTLSEMGLYQVFRSRIINSQIEEIVYKKIGIFINNTRTGWNCIGYAIATLRIPKGVVRYGNKNDKCRCKRAEVIDIKPYKLGYFNEKSLAENPSLFKFGSVRDRGETVYKIGEAVESDMFDYIPNVCSHGIHYFYDRWLAEEYDFG